MSCNLISKSVFVTKSACANFALKFPVVSLLNSELVDAALVAKPLILGILPSISVILELKPVFLIKPLLSGILLSASLIFFSISDLSASYLVFKTNPASLYQCYLLL